METDTVVIDKQPKVFLVNDKQEVPEKHNAKCIHNSTKIIISNTENIVTKKTENVKIQKGCSKFLPFTTHKGIGELNRKSEKINRPLLSLFNEPFKCTFYLKALVLLLLTCDFFYLHVNFQNMESSLQSSLRIIDNLESQLKFSRLSYESFKADMNYLMYLNRMLTKDINSKIELLIKLNKLFIDHADSSLNSVVDTLRNQRHNDDIIVQIINKRNFTNSQTPEYSQSDNDYDTYNENNYREDSLNDQNNFNNLSSQFDDSDYEKTEIDSMNVVIDDLNVVPSGHRNKRQTTNNSGSNNRGKHHNGKLKNRGQHRHVNCNLFCCSAGPLLVHFRGAQPEALIQDGGSMYPICSKCVIAPWFGDLQVSGDYLYRNFLLKEGKAKVEVTEKGLYLIYAQVYYLTSNQLNSFSINLQREKDEQDQVLALCSTETAIQGMSEVSCYTSVVRQLIPGDQIYLIQRERYRRVVFREGHTFLGIVALNNPPKC